MRNECCVTNQTFVLSREYIKGWTLSMMTVITMTAYNTLFREKNRFKCIKNNIIFIKKQAECTTKSTDKKNQF